MRKSYGLTRRQTDLLDYVRFYMAEAGCPPSFEEMREGIGLTSKSGVHRLIAALEERGCIRRLPNRARAIELVEREEIPSPPIRLATTRALIAELNGRGFSVIPNNHPEGRE